MRLLHRFVLTLMLTPLSFAQGQNTPAGSGDDTNISRGTTADAPTINIKDQQPVIAYFMALICSAAAVAIVCAPPRKK